MAAVAYMHKGGFDELQIGFSRGLVLLSVQVLMKFVAPSVTLEEEAGKTQDGKGQNRASPEDKGEDMELIILVNYLIYVQNTSSQAPVSCAVLREMPLIIFRFRKLIFGR